jgi:hypothetical protein
MMSKEYTLPAYLAQYVKNNTDDMVTYFIYDRYCYNRGVINMDSKAAFEEAASSFKASKRLKEKTIKKYNIEL